MKKKIAFIATILSAFALASCSGGENSTNNTSTVRNRGSEDTTIEDVDIPEALRGDGSGYTVKHLLENSDGGFDIVATQELSGDAGTKTKAIANDYKGYTAESFEQQSIKADGTTLIEIKYKAIKYTLTFKDLMAESGILSGSGEYYSYQNKATLVAKPNIGYQFLGWYDGDTKLSSDKTYSFSIEDNLNIVGKFEVLPEFSYFEFESDQSSCVINELKDGAPSSLVVPEGVTKINDDALKDSSIGSIVLPASLTEIGKNAFSGSEVNTLTFNSAPIISDSAFDDCTQVLSNVVNKASDTITIAKNTDFLFSIDEYSDPILVGYFGNDTEVILPDNVTSGSDTYPSYSIGEYALEGNEDIQVLTIPEAVEEIGNGAFYGCENLLEVYNLSNIDVYSSYESGSVDKYVKVVHDSLDEPRMVFRTDNMVYYLEDYGGDIYAMIVSYTPSSKDVVINQVTIMDEDTNETIKCPTGLDNNLFLANNNIETVTLGDGIDYIGEYAFKNCTNLRTVVANDVNTIDESAFQSCVNLKNVTINKCQNIYQNAFYGCYRLSNIDMPAMSYIGSGAFQSCYSLLSITLPNSLNYISSNAFYECYRLKEVKNSTSLTISQGSSSNGYVGYYASYITDSGTSDFYTNTNGYITYLDGSDKHFIAYVGDSKELVIPDDVDYIDKAAFVCGDYTSISIPSTAYLNDSIFYQCSNLEYLDIPCYYNELSYLFKGLSNYQLRTIPSKLKTLRLSGYKSYLGYDYFTDFDSIENLIISYSYDDSYEPYNSLTNLKNVYFDGTIEGWCQLNFDDLNSNPMSKASNFYIKDDNGDVELCGNKYSLLQELTIPSSITSIGNYQFYGFNLKEVVIPSTITEIGQYAFANCTSLKKISLGSNLTDINYGAFSGCSSLVMITIPENVTTLSDYLFANCYSLQKVEFAGNVETIGSSVFKNCYTLNDMILPNSVISIGESAFRNCETMKEFSFKNLGITEIAPYLFAGCRRLTTVEFSDLITEVGDHAFDNCNKIGLNESNGGLYFGTDLKPYKWLIRVEKTATSITVNENCEIILGSAFSTSKVLKSVTIPNTVTKLGQIFKGIDTLEYIEVPFLGDGNGNQVLNYFFGNTSTDYNYAPESLKTVKINGNITSIAMNAFRNNSTLEEVILPDTVTNISENAFYKCGITSIDLKNVETIGLSAFASSRLTTITMTDKLTSIGNYAFQGCYLLETVDMSNITNECTIGTYLFSKCSKLSNVELGNCKKITTNMFEECTSLEDITIPSAISSIDSYGFFKSGLKSIDLSQMPGGNNVLSSAFEGCSNLEEAILPNITKIWDNTFKDCPKLAICEIPSTVTEIGSSAFNNTALRSITIPAGISKTIGNSAFGNNPSLETVTINCTTTAYGYSNAGLFSGTNNIKTVIFGEGAVKVFDKLFMSEKSLTSVTLPSTLTEIGSSAFYGCASLTSISIPENVTSIGGDAFNGCTKLLEVYNESSLTLTAGSQDNGYVAYYALYVHNDVTEDSIYEKDANGFTFIVKDGKGYLFSYDGTNTNITLPNSFTKSGVTYNTYDIHSNAFMNNTTIESVTIPGSVKTIGNSAFEGCHNLKNVVLEEGVEVINENAFYECDALENLTLPNSLEAIYGATSYKNYSNLNYYISPTGDRYLGNETNHYLVFAERLDGRMTLTVQDGCKIIAPYASNYYQYNYELILPEGLEFIGNSAFADNTKMTYSFTFPSTLKYIDNSAFNNSYGFTNILLANTQVEYIGRFAFWADASTNKHANITLPDTLIEIGEYAFTNSLITNIYIPKNVEIIGNRVFYGCSNLVDIEIASPKIEFGEWQFYSCSSLTNVYYDGTIDNWAKFEFAHEYSTPMCNAKNFYILDSNGTVNYNGNKYKLIEDIILPDGIEEIREYTFYNFKVKNVTIPASISKIGKNAFSNCSSLVNVYYDGTINDWVNIEFAEGTSNPMYYASNFYILDSNGTISYNGKKYSVVTKANVTSEITKLSDYVFSGFTDLTTVTLPNTLTEIGNYAFKDCYNLKGLIIPNTVTKIGTYAFKDCIVLENITLSNNITLIGTKAFYGCVSLIDIVLPSNLSTIDESTFENCYNLRNVTIPSSVTRINEKAFYECLALKNVYYDGTVENWCNVVIYNGYSTPMYYASNFYLLDSEGTITYNGNNYELLTDLVTPDSVTTIKAYSFYGFSCINYLTISSKVTTIGISAFAECDHLWITKLGTYDTGSSLTTIGSSAFSNCYRLAEVRNYSSVSISEPGKYSNTDGYISLHAINTYTSSWESSSVFRKDSNGHIIDENGYIFASIWGNYGYLIDYIGDETDLVLPDHFTWENNSQSDYRINDYAFYKNDKITRVVIPSNVKSTGGGYNYKENIGDYAFGYCYNLTSVTIPSNFNKDSFGDDAFRYCNRLYEVYNLSSNLSLSIGDSYPGSYLSYNAKVIHTSTDETSIITTDSNGFMFMYYDNNYYLIGYAGNGEEITLPSSFIFNGNTITDFGVYKNAFKDYKQIRSIIVPETITTLADSSTFSGCKGLLNVQLPDTLTGLGSYTFSSCYSLTSVKIPNGPITIGSYVFYYCTSLNTVIIPKSVKSIGANAFNYDSKLEKIFYEGSEGDWDKITIMSNNEILNAAFKYYYSETKPEEAGNYWHYVNGVPTIW